MAKVAKICYGKRECLFGEIVNGEMVLNDMGRIVVDEWKKTPQMRSNVELDLYSIIPNHFHALFLIHDNVGAHVDRAHISAPLPGQKTNVGAHCMRPESAAMATMLLANDNWAHVSAPLRDCTKMIRQKLGGLGYEFWVIRFAWKLDAQLFYLIQRII